MSLDYEIIGNRIKQARKSKNLTQDDLAEEMNVSVAYLSRIETGNIRINLQRLCQVCSILNITEGQLLDGVSNTSQTYLYSEFSDLLQSCSPSKQRLIYELAKVVHMDGGIN